MDGGDLSDVSVLAHVLQNRLAAVTGAASMLRDHPDLSLHHRDQLLEIVERSANGLTPAIQLLQRGLPAMALLELQQPSEGSITLGRRTFHREEMPPASLPASRCTNAPRLVHSLTNPARISAAGTPAA